MTETERARVAAVIAGIQRNIEVTDADRAAALDLAMDMLAAARRHGFTYEDFTWVGSLPSECLDVVLAKRPEDGR